MEVLVHHEETENKTLPSMPLLFPLSLPSSPVSSPKREDADVPFVLETDETFQTDVSKEEVRYAENEKCIAKEFQDSAYNSIPMGECDELVIRADASPLSEKRKTGSNHPPPKKRRKLEIFEVPEVAEEEPDNHYAEAYFSKVKSMLDEATFQKFIAILSEVSDEEGSAVLLYRKVENLLANFPELVDDFVGLLTLHQALEIGKLHEYKFITRSLAFFKKLEGNHLTRIIHALEQLNTNSHVTPDSIKSVVLPLLKGHGPLADHFLHLLPNEKPPPSSPDEYENITEPMMLEDGDDGGWDHVRIPEHTERGCLSDCPCRCHTAPTQPFCLACNIRFIKGQAYVQYGKVIRYCKVHFNDMSHDEVLQRFNPALYSKIKRKKKSISKAPPSEPFKAISQFMFQDENALLSKDDVSAKIETEMLPSAKIEEKIEDEDDYWEEDDVSSGDKSSAGDLFEEGDRHSEDTDDNTKFLERLAHPLSPLGSTVEGYYLEGEFGEESREAAENTKRVRKGVVIDVSDIRPNGVNAHVIKFETRPSNDPCVNSSPSPDNSNPNSPRHVIRDATVVFDDGEINQNSQFESDVIIDLDEDVVASKDVNDESVEMDERTLSCDFAIVDNDPVDDPIDCDSSSDIKVIAEQTNEAITDEKTVFVAVKSENDPPSMPSTSGLLMDSIPNDIHDENVDRKIESNSNSISDNSTENVLQKMDIERLGKCDVTTENRHGNQVKMIGEKGEEESSSLSTDSQKWTMQEDKLILESFLRKNGVDDETIAGKLRESMPRWTVFQIQERFKVLWDLLMKTMN